MNILFVVSECTGLVKTGGLADVGRALPEALLNIGHDVRVFIPHYQVIAEEMSAENVLNQLGVPMGSETLWASVNQVKFGRLTVYLLERYDFFFRSGLYDDGAWEYPDNAERFAFLSCASLEFCKSIGFLPDVIHCHDWQTAITSYYLKTKYASDFPKTQSVLSIHNSAFQGKFPGDKRHFLGIEEPHFVSEMFEDFGGVNLLKGGIFWADQVNAVSESYAKELCDTPGGHGLETSFRNKGQALRGILNGCDYSEWNPKTDPFVSATYSVENIKGKQQCKADLQQEFSLDVNPELPLFAIVSRLTWQKGFYYLMPVMYSFLSMPVQLVVLGTGESKLEQDFYMWRTIFPKNMGWRGRYSNELAHKIEAGADFFIMPSLYEPCGLNQMYSMSYGTLPIVRSVGGLKDTVQQYNPKSGKGTGFVFEKPEQQELFEALRTAIDTWYQKPNHILKMRNQAMKMRFDWEQAAKQYEIMYQDAIQTSSI